MAHHLVAMGVGLGIGTVAAAGILLIWVLFGDDDHLVSF